MRGRIRARFAELHADREQLEAQLAALAAATPKAADPALLDELPLAGDILPGLPAELKARLLDAFDLQILWNKPGQQATVFAEITEATLQALPGILDPGQDGYDDTAEDDPRGTSRRGGFVRSPDGALKSPGSPNSPRSSRDGAHHDALAHHRTRESRHRASPSPPGAARMPGTRLRRAGPRWSCA